MCPRGRIDGCSASTRSRVSASRPRRMTAATCLGLYFQVPELREYESQVLTDTHNPDFELSVHDG
jgi:hypothetical protein